MRNVFIIESPRKRTLAFATSGGYITGKLLKQIDFRQPNVIKQYKQLAQNSKIGDVLCVNGYVFVLVKKHYANKLTEKDFTKILKDNADKLNEYELKTTNDDYPQYKELILKYIPNLEYRETGEWGVWN